MYPLVWVIFPLVPCGCAKYDWKCQDCAICLYPQSVSFLLHIWLLLVLFIPVILKITCIFSFNLVSWYSDCLPPWCDLESIMDDYMFWIWQEYFIKACTNCRSERTVELCKCLLGKIYLVVESIVLSSAILITVRYSPLYLQRETADMNKYRWCTEYFRCYISLTVLV